MNMFGFLLPLEAAGGEKPNPLLPPLYDVVWSLIVLAIIAVVMVVWVLPKFNQIADERAAKIQEGFDLTEKAKEESRNTAEKVELQLREAREEATRIREEANAQAEDIVTRASDKANEEAKRIIDNAQRQIEAERQAAQLSLRADVGILAVELAEKIVGEQLKDTELSARVVDRFLADLEAQSTKA